MEELQSEEQFDRILAKHTYVLVNGSAKWCQPCKSIYPLLLELIPRYKNITFVKLDIDNLYDLANKLDITGLPSFILMKEGKIENKVVGADLVKVKRMLETISKK